jgi:hypothetical protein
MVAGEKGMRKNPKGPKGSGAFVGLIVVYIIISSLGAFATFASSFASLANAQPKPAAPIVSLVPALTEIVFAVGSGDRVVAVSSYDEYPPEVKALPRVGALLDPDVERIISLRPDLVLLYGSQTDLMAQLKRASIGYYEYRHGDLSAVTATIRALGERTGREAAADSLAARIERRLAELRRRTAGQPRPRTRSCSARTRPAEHLRERWSGAARHPRSAAALSAARTIARPLTSRSDTRPRRHRKSRNGPSGRRTGRRSRRASRRLPPWESSRDVLTDTGPGRARRIGATPRPSHRPPP